MVLILIAMMVLPLRPHAGGLGEALSHAVALKAVM
jgi:hypothetical protein